MLSRIKLADRQWKHTVWPLSCLIAPLRRWIFWFMSPLTVFVMPNVISIAFSGLFCIICALPRHCATPARRLRDTCATPARHRATPARRPRDIMRRPRNFFDSFFAKQVDRLRFGAIFFKFSILNDWNAFAEQFSYQFGRRSCPVASVRRINSFWITKACKLASFGSKKLFLVAKPMQITLHRMFKAVFVVKAVANYWNGPIQVLGNKFPIGERLDVARVRPCEPLAICPLFVSFSSVVLCCVDSGPLDKLALPRVFLALAKQKFENGTVFLARGISVAALWVDKVLLYGLCG